MISLGGVILLAFSKMIFPLVLLGGGSYVAWRSLFKKWDALLFRQAQIACRAMTFKEKL